MKFTQIPVDTFETIQLNAGILCEDFDPETLEVTGLLGGTTGGLGFNDSPEFVDFGDDIDNAPKNTLELKILDSRDVKMSGTFVTVSAGLIQRLIAAADVNGNAVIPRRDLKTTDFKTIWFVGDYSNNNDGSKAGYIAIKMLNTLSTGGFSLQTTDKEKGQFAFEFTAHTSIEAQDVVPYEVYIQKGEEQVEGKIRLSKKELTVEDGSTKTLTATTIPSDAVVSWLSTDTSVATVSGGVVTGVEVGGATIIASIAVNGVSYSDTCSVSVVEPSA